MKPKFKKAVDTGDLEGVRISLASEMMLDPRGESFKEMRTYAENTIPNLYEVHNGATLDQNRENWTESLLFSTRNALDENFSKERLDYYFNVAKVVLKDKADNLNREDSRASGYSASRTHSAKYSESHKQNVEPLSVCLTIGGLLVGSTGLILGRTIIAAIGLAGAAIGGYKLYNNNQK